MSWNALFRLLRNRAYEILGKAAACHLEKGMG
jgi:hypothetical protein